MMRCAIWLGWAAVLGAQTMTRTTSTSFSQTIHRERVTCPSRVRHRTELVARMAGGPVVYETTFDGAYWSRADAVMQAKAALERTAAPKRIQIQEAHFGETTTSEIEKVPGPRREARTTWNSRRVTKGPATVQVGLLGNEAQPCVGFTDSGPVGCPLGEAVTLPAGTTNIDALTHLHVDLYEEALETEVRVITTTIELTGMPATEPVAADFTGFQTRLKDGEHPRANLQVSNSSGETICVNLYSYAGNSEEMLSCCSCPVEPQTTLTLSSIHDALAPTVLPPNAAYEQMELKLTATVPENGQCREAAAREGTMATGLEVWGATMEKSGPPVMAPLVQRTRGTGTLAGRCGKVRQGLCRSCRKGAVDAFPVKVHPYCAVER